MERRVTLSSIRAPKLGRRDEKPEPWATEAKEYLRSLLIGDPSAHGMQHELRMISITCSGIHAGT